MVDKQITKCTVLNTLFKEYPDSHQLVNSPYDMEEQQLLYIIAGRFASYLLDLYRMGDSNDLTKFATFIEDLHVHGDEYTKELATIGFLEDIINVWSHNHTDPKIIYDYFLPESKKWRDELERLWNGEVRYVGESFVQT